MAKETLNLNEDYIGTVQDGSFNNPKEWTLYYKLFSVIKLQELFDWTHELSEEQKKILQWQIERFVKLMGADFVSQNEALSSLPAWTLIHSTDFRSEEDKEKLKSISDTWVLTWQAFWIPEEGETYYCADFVKVWKDCEIKNWRAKKCVGKFWLDITKGASFSNPDAISFIITPNEKMRELSSYDCYSDDENGKITKTFVKEERLPLKSEKPFFGLHSDIINWWDFQTNIWSSILFWVPSNFITWIVCWDNVIKDKEKLLFLKDIFPGRVLYDKEWNIVIGPEFSIKEDINTPESIEKIKDAFSFYKNEILPLILDNPKVTQQIDWWYHSLNGHTKEVVFRGICYAVSLWEDPIPVVFACACHDLARTNNEYDEEHWPNAVPVTTEIINNEKFNLTEKQKKQIIEAVRDHTIWEWGKAPNYISACLRDADRTRLSQERGYKEEFYSTEQGKKIAAQRMFSKGRRDFRDFENSITK